MADDSFASWPQNPFHLYKNMIHICYMFQNKKAECQVEALIFEGERVFHITDYFF